MRKILVPISGFAVIVVLLVLINVRYVALHAPAVVKVTVREGMTAPEITALLHRAYVLKEEDVLPDQSEGYYFPDTYEFFVLGGVDAVVKKFTDNFNRKVLPLIPADKDPREVLIIASMIEKEADNFDDRRLISDVLWKRLEVGMGLQVDSTICYIKKPKKCLPIQKSDLQIDSLYNTYLYRGLPPGPISNPGRNAIIASINPKSSPYFFYLSDPQTNRTHLATTFYEHINNINKYLR